MLTTFEKTELDKKGYLLMKNLITDAATDQLRKRALELAISEQKDGTGHTYNISINANAAFSPLWIQSGIPIP